jgi:prolyl-tRNA synthetase
VPVRLEIGPKDVAADRVVLVKRTDGDKREVPTADAIKGMTAMLADVQQELYDDAKAFREANTHEATDFDSLRDGIQSDGGFWVGSWCGDSACEEKVTVETKATIRLLEFDRTEAGGPCAVCGKEGAERVVWARAY